ncbi:DUF3562 domain-containing protein [Burkholderia multivorans]|uniref:DUF3562 domain-containing protein n=1 Tax=Burkholderia multivorans TaxID=87883 RepID=UPI000CFF8FAE|nr:DUF3562 domain-containing protein [Burkholderia multivorans]MBU9518020.1 DUF3562 domain-containing protein [Burkholderia multivorans]MDN7475452.1 DUF3562 domain-containing protein [Burkholderia multivorans]PRE05872.1 hypothetical protein C6P91_10740 [Burkholderia multivorans]PRE17140.1 hypothetical protein C6P78_11150 [Burkholderia multivorans]PRE65294.1 hypothetical protein C6P82_16155 [Burkholderia multivorans]
MSQDDLLDSLKEAAARRAIDAEQLHAMLDAEIRALSSGARVHDYIRVIAIRHLRERMRESADIVPDARARGAGDDPPGADARSGP